MRAPAGQSLELTLTVPDELLAAVAERVAALATTHPPATVEVSPWLDADAAARYVGISLHALYKLTAANALPVRRRRRGQGLRFRREELDAWIEAEYESTGWTRGVELSSITTVK